ncbi:hypothetical protein ABBQ38_008261 [Trebouxia sp. C0009 RCD-2024]
MQLSQALVHFCQRLLPVQFPGAYKIEQPSSGPFDYVYLLNIQGLQDDVADIQPILLKAGQQLFRSEDGCNQLHLEAHGHVS